MPIDTLIFDPSTCGFPKPRIPLLPTGLACLSLKVPAPWSPAESFRHFTRGRYARRGLTACPASALTASLSIMTVLEQWLRTHAPAHRAD